MTPTTRRRAAQPPTTPLPAMPPDLEGWHWERHSGTDEVQLRSHHYHTKWYYKPERAIDEAQRYVLSQPKPIEQQPTVQYIPLDQIRTDGGTQARAQLDPATVEEYAETWRSLSHQQNGFDRMPPIVVYYDGSAYWLADGFHRVEAYTCFVNGREASASQRGLMAEVRQGTRRDAVLYACGANAAHGLRRTNADKRRAVETLLRDEEWRGWSNRKIADACAVDHKTVADVRDQLAATGEIPQSTERQGADGRTTNTAGIIAANEARAQPTDDQVVEMRQRFYALGYEQFYRSDAGWTAYHPKTKKANYKTWADVEADIARKEAMAAPRICETCGGPWGAPGSMVTSEGMLCQDCAAKRLSSGKPFRSVESEAQIRRCGRCKKPHAHLTGYGEGIIADYPNGVILCHPCIVELLREQRERQQVEPASAPEVARCEECGREATNKQTIGGMLAHRCDTCAAQARYDAAQQQAEAARADGPLARFIALCDRAVELGATVNPTAYNDPRFVQVVPPKGYQPTPLKCDASDLAKLIAAWEGWQTPPPVDDWAWPWEADAALSRLHAARKDQAAALRATAALMMTLAGDATRLALTQAEQAAQILEAEGYASIASFLRLLVPPDDAPAPAPDLARGAPLVGNDGAGQLAPPEVAMLEQTEGSAT